jgi:hypothetical protein
MESRPQGEMKVHEHHPAAAHPELISKLSELYGVSP